MNKKIITSLILIGVFLLIGGVTYYKVKQVSIVKPNEDIFPNPPTATQAPAVPNPASVNCEKQGGTLHPQKRGDGGEYNLCDFGDNMACEEWALFNGKCPKGGIKTTGYNNVEQKYCAWLGGKTIAQPNATCTLPKGTKCSVDALYNGTCIEKNAPSS